MRLKVYPSDLISLDGYETDPWQHLRLSHVLAYRLPYAQNEEKHRHKQKAVFVIDCRLSHENRERCLEETLANPRITETFSDYTASASC